MRRRTNWSPPRSTTGCEVLEVFFNILHQDVRRAFPLVREKGAGVIAKVPLDSGWLTGRFSAATVFSGIRARWSPEQVARRAELVAQLGWLTADGFALSAKALAYVLSYGEVSCVIPGLRSLRQLHDNLGAVHAALTEAERVRLESFWDEVTAGGRNLLPW